MYLMDRGASLECETCKGFFISCIVENGWYDAFLLALEKVANIWHCNEEFRSLLEKAVLAKSVPIVKYLLYAGCDWIKHHSREYLAVHTSLDVLSLLIHHGFSFDLEECKSIL
jgi:hypothetical protein